MLMYHHTHLAWRRCSSLCVKHSSNCMEDSLTLPTGPGRILTDSKCSSSELPTLCFLYFSESILPRARPCLSSLLACSFNVKTMTSLIKCVLNVRFPRTTKQCRIFCHCLFPRGETNILVVLAVILCE